MKKKCGRIAALSMATLMAASGLLMGCGSKKSASEGDTSYTWLIDTAEMSEYYTEYEDNPIMKYWMDMEWDAEGTGDKKKITIDFSAPPKGSESDNVNTLLATGEYPDVMSTSYSSEGVAQLYEEGIAIDLTDYVEKYMPNYMAWIEEHPEYADQMVNQVDGEAKYLQIYGVADRAEDAWSGLVYRRDWIVKYGTNPQTGAKFTGAWEGDDYVDDVVFPSGNTYPVYISDWEWMMEIFEKALKDQKIDDGYAMQMYYTGVYEMGDFVTSFTGGNGAFYLDKNGECQFAPTQEGFRSYIECMSTWYDNGWVDPQFEENSSDMMFWKVDTPSVYSGKVGAWYGMNSQLGKEMDVSDGDTSNAIHGIVVEAAPQPINDMYGDESLRNQTPTTYFGNSVLQPSVVLTNKVEEKDIPTLLTAMDYFYSMEGGKLKYLGFNDKQQKEVKDEFYNEYGYENGIYTEKEIDGETIYVAESSITLVDGLEAALKGYRVPGLCINDNVDNGYTPFQQRSVELWSMYPNTGLISSPITSQMTADQSTEASSITSNVRTYNSQAIPDFITGRKDVTNDSDWKAFCDGLEAYKPETYVGYINGILGK